MDKIPQTKKTYVLVGHEWVSWNEQGAQKHTQLPLIIIVWLQD